MGIILQIKVLDHIIIGDNTYFSFTDAGLIQKYEDSFINLKIRSIFEYNRELPEAGKVCNYNLTIYGLLLGFCSVMAGISLPDFF